MIKLGAARKFIAILANASLLFNSFVPFLLAVKPAYAQEAIIPEVVAPTVAPEAPVIIEVTPEPTVESTPTPEVTPIVEVTPEPTVEITPTIIESTPTPEITIEPTITSEPIIEITSAPVEPTTTPEPTAEITPEVVPTVTTIPVFEKVCLTDQQIKDTTNEEWIIDDVNGISETKGKVQLGVKYIYPQESKVSVTFKCLPKDESLRTSLKIEKVKTADLNLPDTMGSVEEYAYDITTGMKDGDFNYDVTLPKPADSTAEISYIEKSIDEAKANLTFFDISKIEESKIEQSSNELKAINVDHFTIFFVTKIVDTVALWSDTLSNSEKEMVKYSDNIRYENNGLWPIALQWGNEFIQFDNGNTFPVNINVSSAKIIFEYKRDTKYWLAPEYARIRVWDGSNWQLLPDNLWISNSGVEQTFNISIPLSYVNTAAKLNNFKYQFKLVGAPKTQIDRAVLDINYSFCGDNFTNQNLDEQCDDGNTINGDGCSSTCQIESSITIIKDAQPNSSQDFIFTFNGIGGIPSQFSLDDDDDATLSNTHIKYLSPNIYDISEQAVDGWTMEAVNCQSNKPWDPQDNFGNGTASFSLIAGENVVCTFTNTKKGSLKIIKDSQPNDTQNFIFRLKDSNNNQIGSTELDDDNVPNSRPNNYTFTNLTPASYRVYEDSVSGWTLDNVICTNTTGKFEFSSGYLTIDVLPGEQPVCTFINTQDTGTITIIKDAINNSEDNFYFDSNFSNGDFELEDDGNSGNYGTPETRTYTLPIGSYWTDERDIAGWKLTDIICTGDDHGSVNKTTGKVDFDLDKNESIICTYTNTKTSSIKVIKQSNPEDTQNFIFTLSGVGSTELDDDSGHDASARPNNHTFSKLLPGTYTLSENEVDGWYLDSISCTGASFSNKSIKNRSIDITVTAGQNPVCTFNNYKYGSIRVCKIIIDGDNKVVNGSETLGTSFTINWNKGLSPTVFNAGYTANTRLLKSTPHNKKDAYCTTIRDLEITNYRYSQESISDPSIWQTPKYNDQYNDSVHNLGDFYTYNNNTNSNGDINLALDPPGINRTLVILNQYKHGSINVTKFNDKDGDKIKDDGEEVLSGWTINLSSNGSKVTGENGSVTFDNLTPNTYTLSENIQGGWTQTGITCSNNTQPTPTVTQTPTATPTQAPVCNKTTWNYSECNDGPQTELPNNACYGGKDTYCRAEFNCTRTGQDGVWSCPSNQNLEVFNFLKVKPVMASEIKDSDSYNHKLVTVNAGDNLTCYIGNQLIIPTATISKSNNAGGSLNPGNSIEYTINLNILGNDVTGFNVTDLLSNGFKYRPGSYKVYKNGLPYFIIEPEYHSPGVWNLGNLQAGDELILTYIADISADQQAGTYFDLTYAKGLAAYGDKDPVIALNNSDQFVGTQVPVVKSNQNSVSAGVERTETVGQVLGASTEMPSTGAATIWLAISGLLGIAGFSLLKISKKTMLTILLTLLSFGLLINPVKIQAADLLVKLEIPRSPTNFKEVDLKFVALDISGGSITAKCFKKGPNDSAFSQFGSDIILADGGNSSSCALYSAINDSGSYQFYVTANSVASNTVNLDYKNSIPDTPYGYRKEKVNNCDYKIHFKTGNDSGKTVKVEVYRADITNFILDDGSKIAGINIGSNQEYDLTNSVPNCNKEYYYVLRAFDDAGNGSGTVGDRVTVNTITTSTSSNTTGSVSGAIPLVGSNNVPQETTEELGQESGAGSEQQGTVLGTEKTESKSFITQFQSYVNNHKFFSILLAISFLAIINYGVKKVQGKRK